MRHPTRRKIHHIIKVPLEVTVALSEDPSLQPPGIQTNVGLTGNGPDMKDQLTAGEETRCIAWDRHEKG